MPVRQLSNAIKPAKASSNKDVTISTLRLPASGGESSAGASGSSTTISLGTSGMGYSPGGAAPAASQSGRAHVQVRRSVGDETCLSHQALVERLVALKELEHVRARQENRLQRLFLHVVFELGRLRDALEEVDVERRLLGRDFAGQEHRAQHLVLHIESFFLAGRDVVPRLGFGDL